jgi:ribosomal protein L1
MEGILFPGQTRANASGCERRVQDRIGRTGELRRDIMAPKQKRRSVMDTLRDLLDKLNQLGPLLGPRSLQPVPVPVRNPERRRR